MPLPISNWPLPADAVLRPVPPDEVPMVFPIQVAALMAPRIVALPLISRSLPMPTEPLKVALSPPTEKLSLMATLPFSLMFCKKMYWLAVT